MGKWHADGYEQVSAFRLEGRFLGFVVEAGYKLKRIRLATASGEYRIKVPKELRPSLYRMLTPGEWIEVSGYQKFDSCKGTTKLKAELVMPIAPHSPNQMQKTQAQTLPVDAAEKHLLNSAPKHAPKQETILVCQKSDCCKRGATFLMQALQQELGARGLTEQVKIRGTGCMKQCKAGPNLVMPNKARYSRIQAEQISELIEQHFSE